jgi:hypothetical protein
MSGMGVDAFERRRRHLVHKDRFSHGALQPSRLDGNDAPGPRGTEEVLAVDSRSPRVAHIGHPWAIARDEVVRQVRFVDCPHRVAGHTQIKSIHRTWIELRYARLIADVEKPPHKQARPYFAGSQPAAVQWLRMAGETSAAMKARAWSGSALAAGTAAA